MVKSLVQNPYLYLGSYVRSLVSSVMYCILEPLAASINPLNDHWTLRDYAALLLSHIFWYFLSFLQLNETYKIITFYTTKCYFALNL